MSEPEPDLSPAPRPELGSRSVVDPTGFVGQGVPRDRASFVRLWLAGFLGLEAAAWFSMSGLDYRAGGFRVPFTTAGWFVIGQFLLLPVAGLISCAAAALIRRSGRRLAWWLLLSLCTLLVGYALRSALPRERLRAVIGPEVHDSVEIRSLTARDSFRDGWYYRGLLRVEPEFGEFLLRQRPMRAKLRAATRLSGRRELDALQFPDDALCYEDDFSTFCFTADKRLCYFEHTTQARHTR